MIARDRSISRARTAAAIAAALAAIAVVAPSPRPVAADIGRVPGGGVLRISVPEAFGGKTVIGQLTVDQVVGAGWVAAYGCDDGIPTDNTGAVSRSDLNYNSASSPFASNRLIVKADNNGDVCFYTSDPAAIIVDVNAVTFDTGVSSFPNRRTDTRQRPQQTIEAGGVLRVNVTEALGGRTVVGQLTVDQVTSPGFVTVFGCDDGIPTDRTGAISRSDLNYDPTVAPFASNRLIVKADNDGDVCFLTSRPVAIIVDVNGVSDTGIGSFPNRRTDTRQSAEPIIVAGGMLRVSVPEALGGKTVIGQLTVDRVQGAGFVTAFGCDDGIPTDSAGAIARSDLNYNAAASPIASNRLIVKADNDGDVCFLTSRPVAFIVDLNGVSDTGISSFPNRRTDTRAPSGTHAPSVPIVDGVPVWPPFQPRPALGGVAALTGLAADAPVTQRPLVAVKIDNYVQARPQWGLDQADAVIELNAEGVSRFIALFHSNLPSVVGPVRSARTGDLDMLTAMNRPVFVYSGANLGVTQWVESAARSGLLIDFSAQHSPCYSRSPNRPGPHNLLLDPACAIAASAGAGPAGPLWTTDATWTPPVASGATPDTTFTVPMDGVRVEWTWDAGRGRYLRTQNEQPHVAMSGAQIAADNVVELATTYIPSPVDARSPNPLTVGSGIAVVHRDGRSIPAMWSRATPYEPFQFRDTATNQPIPLDTGVTFLELERG